MHDKLVKKIRQNVRALREKRGLTLAGLAGQAGISIPYLSQLEHGVRAPSLETVCKLAGAFRVPLSTLLEG